MAQKIINTKIREAYDTEANWIKYNPVLLAGQLAYSSDKYGKYKVGDGTSKWNQLQYITLGWSDITGKPSTFNPVTHNHDDRYYTETEMNTKLGEKANTSALTSHTGNSDIHVTTTDKTNWNAAKAHASSAHAPSNAQANQNAFSNVVVGGTTINADTPTDTLTLVAGSNIAITPDATNDKITISATDTKYTHPSTHSASMITQDASHRFVTDAEKNTWNGKANGNHTHTPSQVGLGNVNNTADSEKDVKSAGFIRDSQNNRLIELSYDASAVTTASYFPAFASNSEIRAIKASNLRTAIGAAPSSHEHPQKESMLSWGGKNFAGSYGVVDAAMIGELGANRFEFGHAEGISITYSRNNGSSWEDYGASNDLKTRLFSSKNYDFIIGKADATNKATANYLLRVEIDTGKFACYSQLHKFAIYLSTNGCTGSYCTIDIALQSTPTVFKTIANKIPVSGWSGWNIINVPEFITYGNSASSQYGRIRFTFGCTGGSTQYVGLYVNKIMAFGGVGWTVPSTMARTGHLYGYNSYQDAIFPSNVQAKTFIGGLNGNASSANSVPWSGVTGRPSSMPASDVYAWAKASSKPTYTKAEIGLSNVDNTADNTKSVKYATTAGSATNATTATKLGTTTKGSATQPIYLDAGVPTACTYTLGKSVPSNAVFTDTNTWIALKGATTTSAGTAGYAPAPSAGAANRYLRSDGTWAVPPDTNTTYGVVSTTANGLMSSGDKTKLDGIATGANKYVLPTASSSVLGGVKTTSQVTSASGYTACPIIGGVPYYKDTNTTYTLGSFGITATAAELNFCDGVTSNIQTQLNGKAASSHIHNYLPLSGGTLSGVLSANARIKTTSVGSSWISGKNIENASLCISTKNTSNSYHPIIAGQTFNSHVWNLGTITDTVGFYGYQAKKTENGTDWSFAIDVSTGVVRSTGDISAPNFNGKLAWSNITGVPNISAITNSQIDSLQNL